MAIMKRHYFAFHTDSFSEALDLSKRAKEVGGRVFNDGIFLHRPGEKTYGRRYCVNCFIPETEEAYAHLHSITIEEARKEVKEARNNHRKWFRDWATGKVPKNGPYEYN